MNEVQIKLGELESNGWTLAAIATELGVTVNAVEKWKAGDRYPANSKATLHLLEKLAQKKRVPRQKRYSPDSRKMGKTTSTEIDFYKVQKRVRAVQLAVCETVTEPYTAHALPKVGTIQGKLPDLLSTENNVTFHELESTILPVKNIPAISLNNIYHADCIELMSSMDENFVDLTVTSPPYDELRNYHGYHFDFEGIAKNLFRITKKGGVLVWVVGDKIKNGNRSLTSFKQALFFQEIGFNVHDVMIYKKKNTPFMRTNAYTNCFEFMFVFSKGSPKTHNPLKVKTARQGQEMLPFNKGADGINKKILGELKPEKTMTNIWEYAVGLHGTTSDKIAFKHPAVFPEKLAQDHILSWTNEGDLVLDPMCGSGTTCKMAVINNRKFIGIDISEEYCEIAQKRLSTVLKRLENLP